MTYKYNKGIKTISVSGQDDVVADSDEDTLTLVAGSNITLTTSAGGDSVTIAAAGGGGGSAKWFHQQAGRMKFTVDGKPFFHGANPDFAAYGYLNINSSGMLTNYSEGDSSFDITYYYAFKYAVNAVAPFACDLTKFSINYSMRYNLDAHPIWEIWKGSLADGSSHSTSGDTLTFSRLHSSHHSGDPGDDTVWENNDTISSGNAVTAGDMICFSCRNGGDDAYIGSNSESEFYATLTFEES